MAADSTTLGGMKPPSANAHVRFFDDSVAFRKWLQQYHRSAAELWVGFRKVGTGRPSIRWPESVDEALCFGWIDGLRKRLDDTSYAIRFSPRKPASTWSAVNIARARALIDAGRMQPAGLKAFDARRENRSGVYTYQQRSAELPPPYAAAMAGNKAASAFFEAQPGSYRKAMMWWIVSAKREQTRRKRLSELIEFSANGKWLPQYLRLQPQGRGPQQTK